MEGNTDCCTEENTAPRSASAPHGWVASVASLALIAGLGALAYGNGFDGVFLFDDHTDIDGNPAIRSLDSLWKVVSEQGQSGVSGRPAVALSYAYNYAWCGLETWGWHVVNLVIHVVAAWFLFASVRRALSMAPFAGCWSARAQSVALAAASIWVAHPLTTGSVMYLGQRVESLMGMFFLATLYSALRAFAAPGSRVWPALAMLSCALGTGCKEVIVGAPLLVLLYDSLYVSGSAKAAWRAHRALHVGLFATWPLLAIWVLLAQGRSESVGFGYSEVGVWEYLTTQAWAVAHYARLSLWPDPLIFDYGVQPIVDPARWLAPGVLVVAALVWTVWGLVRRTGAAFLGAVWFVILAPTSSVLPIVTELVVEHRAYLPSAAVVVGVALALAVLLERFVAAPKARLAAGVVLTSAVAAAAVFTTRERNRDYASEIGMWRDVLDKLPTNARAQASYGNDLVSAGREPDAGQHYAEAVRLHPENGYWRANLGTWLMSNGKLEEAIAELERSRAILPEYGMTLQNLGEAYSRRGESDKALDLWRSALEHGAPQPGALAARVSPLLLGRKRDAEALAACRAAVRSAPNDPLALATLARALLQTSDTKLRDPIEAGGLALRAAMLKRGTDAELFELQADALVQHGRNGEAAGALRNAEAVWRAQNRADRAEAAARRATALLAAPSSSR